MADSVDGGENENLKDFISAFWGDTSVQANLARSYHNLYEK